MNIVLSVCSKWNKIFTWGVIVNKIDPVNQFSRLKWITACYAGFDKVRPLQILRPLISPVLKQADFIQLITQKTIWIKEECAHVNKYENIFYLKTPYCFLFYHLTTTILVSFWHKLVSSRNVSFLVVIHMIHHTWWLDIPLNCYICKFNIWTKFSLHQGPWQVWIFTNAALSACYNFKKWSSRVGMYMYLWSLWSWSF